MTYPAEKAVMDTVWAALREPVRQSFVDDAQARVGRLAAEPWIDALSVCDLIEDFDSRLHEVPLRALASVLGVGPRMILQLDGRKTRRSFFGSERFAPVDAAALMIFTSALASVSIHRRRRPDCYPASRGCRWSPALSTMFNPSKPTATRCNRCAWFVRSGPRERRTSRGW